MGQSFERDDKAIWRSHGSTVGGTVEKRLAGDQQAAGGSVRAAREKAQNLVCSDQTRHTAAHRPEAPKRKS